MSGTQLPSDSQRLPPSELLPLDEARNSLFLVWACGAGPFIFILVIQSNLNVFGDRVQEVWGWALPTIMPTLGMIITVLGYTALDPSSSTAVVRRGFFRISWWMSFFYLLLILMTVLVQPILNFNDRFEAMKHSNLYLGPIQGLVASALGVLFVTKQSKNGIPR